MALWLDILREKNELAGQLSEKIPRFLAYEGLTLDQATRLHIFWKITRKKCAGWQGRSARSILSLRCMKLPMRSTGYSQTLRLRPS